jgi:hypothetical protein
MRRPPASLWSFRNLPTVVLNYQLRIIEQSGSRVRLDIFTRLIIIRQTLDKLELFWLEV